MDRLSKALGIFGIGALVLTLSVWGPFTRGSTERERHIKYEENFPEDKFLTVSAEDYCKSEGKELSDYKLVGIHGHIDFGIRVPKETEVVVEYRGIGDSGLCATALIPRNQ